jgi:lipopolysaccharide/colanic/teichoic acid biosynthesis glycosyltransferase
MQRVTKRALDIVVSAIGLVLAAPIAVIVMGLIKLTSPGPVFYRQARVGQDGKTFMITKFRSMRVDAEVGTGPVWAQKNDSRVTPIGGFLRRSRLDEIPQLWNALRGDMSVVGPRPLRPDESDTTGSGGPLPLSAIPGYAARHRIRPGLTGLAQVRAPRDLSRTAKFRYDLLYQRRANLCFDMALILQSFWITARGRWEAQGRRTRTTPPV